MNEGSARPGRREDESIPINGWTWNAQDGVSRLSATLGSPDTPNGPAAEYEAPVTIRSPSSSAQSFIVGCVRSFISGLVLAVGFAVVIAGYEIRPLIGGWWVAFSLPSLAIIHLSFWIDGYRRVK